jgi:hypothetical protein
MVRASDRQNPIRKLQAVRTIGVSQKGRGGRA